MVHYAFRIGPISFATVPIDSRPVWLEAIEPAHGALPTLCKPLEDLVEMDALVPTDTQGGTVHETDPGAVSHAALLHEQDEGNGNLPLQFYEAVIGDSLGKQVVILF